MAKLLATLARWLLQKTWLLLLILALLLLGAWMRGAWKQVSEDQQLLEKKRSLQSRLQADLREVEAEIEANRDQWEQQRVELQARLAKEIEGLNEELGRMGEELREKAAAMADLQAKAMNHRRQANTARRRMLALKEEIGWFDRKREDWTGVPSKDKVQYEMARKAWQALDLRADASQAALAAFDAFDGSRLDVMIREREEKRQAMSAARESLTEEEAALLAEQERKQQELATVADLVEAQRARLMQDPRQRFVAAVRAELPTALYILLAIILTPIAIKAFFYYVLAPLAARLPPIRILRQENAPLVPEPLPSAVSMLFTLSDEQELLVHPDFLQSSSQPASKRTKFLLNNRLPFSSIASGMCMLTRLRPEAGSTTQVVVSSLNDPLGEIGALELPEGAAMVIQPRSLAGVLKPRDAAVRITRHWRLFSLHAWLTLQLRYLVFHGPCTLILKGCRGVRAEQPDPAMPRLINQAATIGFSANLAYQTTRCETFISYLRGKEDLFNDLFAGEGGRFVYEEMPGPNRRGGVTGRGLEGIADAALKVFGI